MEQLNPAEIDVLASLFEYPGDKTLEQVFRELTAAPEVRA